jgi:hypothetical protein
MGNLASGKYRSLFKSISFFQLPKTMKTKSTFVLLWLATFALPAFADTIFMKDGTTIEGAVVREDATSYTVEVQITKSIKDEQVILKADVDRVRKVGPDIAAFDEISTFVPTPDAMTSGEYAQRIQMVEKFLSDHRGSVKSKDAKAILTTLKQEANEVLAGGIKVDGKIISPSDYLANQYSIDSRIEAAKIKQFVDSANYLQALRTFTDFDKDFRSTAAYEEIRPLISRVIRTYVGGIAQSLATFDARTKKRMVGLEQMTPADRGVTERAIAEETAAIEKRFKAEKDAKIGWVTTAPFFKPSLEATVNFGKQELTRLDAQGANPDADGGKAYRDALSKIHGGDKAAATAALTAAKAAGVSPRYIDLLNAAADKSAGDKP